MAEITKMLTKELIFHETIPFFHILIWRANFYYTEKKKRIGIFPAEKIDRKEKPCTNPMEFPEGVPFDRGARWVNVIDRTTPTKKMAMKIQSTPA